MIHFSDAGSRDQIIVIRRRFKSFQPVEQLHPLRKVEELRALKQIDIKLFEYFHYRAESEREQGVGGFVDEVDES